MKRIKIFFAIAATLVITNNFVLAQDGMTSYTMSTLPQAYYDNPGQMPLYKIHIGCLPIVFLPVLSSNYTSISNSGFKYDDLIHQRKSDDSLYFDFEDVVDGLAKKNHLILNQQIELLSFGFKIKRVHYVSLSLTEKLRFRFTYPRDLLSMIWRGNSQFIGSAANFNGLGAELTHYRELALGYTYNLNSKWTVGGRFKLLFGMSNVYTKKSKLSLEVDEEYYNLTANSDFDLYTSAPEKIYNTLFDNDTMTIDDYKDYLFNFNNPGFGIDLGATYKINEKWTVGASVIDFGYIFWKTETRRYSMSDKSFTFQGIDIADFFRKDSTQENAIDKLLDSIANIFKIEEENKRYSSPLPTKIYLSGYYNISKKDRAAVIFRGEIYGKTFQPAFTIAYNRLFKNILDFSFSYSYMNREWLNFGIGAALRFGPFQIFLSTDNFLAAIIPYHTKNFNVHFGCNYIFYQKVSNPLMKL
ncbi:MAG: DUF5723 family protein [Bacteroidales bacterium]|jgi:hypothetical protein|nr:DUF5723 family protein [Bacteroidales bacterium]MDD4214204.1 DUF5723 family protein [Bacteroidales bacterium]